MISFSKMHGCGNDFIVVDGRREDLDWPSLAKEMSDRHFGVGSDGLIVICTSTVCPIRMRMFNPDGSEAEMCGNGIRCFAKFVVEREIMPGTPFKVETGAGILAVEPYGNGRVISGARIGMGVPILQPTLIPVDINSSYLRACPADGPILDYPVSLDGKSLAMTFISMGNPHAVTFLDGPIENFPLDVVGPKVEHHSVFPKRTNFEIVSVVNEGQIQVRVWERGAGLTLACGTGACAAAAASRLKGLTGEIVDVELPGGTLHIEWSGTGELYLSGPVEEVFAGEWPSP